MSDFYIGDIRNTPRRRVRRLNIQIRNLKLNAPEQDICMICEHLVIYGSDETEADCRKCALAWEIGNHPITRCRKFRAVPHWRVIVLSFLFGLTISALHSARKREG